jgi:hypothetical protein
VTVERLARSLDQLNSRLTHWTPSQWAASSVSSDRSRAEVVHALVQRLADLAAAAEGQPCRAVPRLPNDLSLPDQLRVVLADLVAAEPDTETVRRATELITDVRRSL